jgi:hypothetical protein
VSACSVEEMESTAERMSNKPMRCFMMFSLGYMHSGF